MNSKVAGAGLALMVLAMASSPALAEVSPEAPVPSQAPAKPPFVPAGFTVPVLTEAKGFKLVPLGPSLARIDYDAYMSSVEHLQKTFSRSPSWPHEGITDADTIKDMETEQARFANRTSFAYAVLTPDGLRERGCVYVRPSPVAGYDAVVRMWVTQAEYDAGFEAELYGWVTQWIKADWPFAKVAYPGHSVDWAAWDALVAAKKPAGS
ncbi:twin-arginine translocation pathway signal protein [Novosphingobium naphthalenivorans]|uniref:twin-arginine translocation pathway signal protein n=1 Tax=Novosphingobium naphthalenivorans TaxID=273168 RepID=UPI0008344D0A|nr:twin-arginine translocation pathway signal protein [Novosphingobium naphthalenivorans]